MKKLLVILFLLSSLPSFAQDFPEKPNPPRLVNDFANMLTAAEEASLEQKLVGYEDTTSTQIAIVTLNSIGVYDASDYAVQLAEKWGIGQKGKNNGVLILVSLQDRHSFISIGYGLEGALPDAYVAGIRDENLRPNLKAGEYFQAFDQTTTALIQLASGEFKGTPKEKEEKTSILPLIILAFVFFFFVLPIFRRGRKVRGSHFGGGGLGWLTTLFLMNSMGRGDRRDGGTWGDFTGGRGDFGGGGGGFGGFGGGDFGGGGAGGDW